MNRPSHYLAVLALIGLLMAGAAIAQTSTATFALKPMDLQVSAQDLNGLPLNPKWSFQVMHDGQLPNPMQLCWTPWPVPTNNADPRGKLDVQKCTNQVTDSDSSFLCGPHLNWSPATYDGTIFWDSKSSVGADDDYNLWLQRPDKAGWTAADSNGPQLEFDSDETIDHFASFWWSSFHAAVDRDNWSARVMMDNKYAIVMGLVSLDCAHSCGAELHPVYAMAVRVKDDPRDETWAIFVRNWGDEGFCSSRDHPQPITSFAFRLPWRAQADSFTTGGDTMFNLWFVDSDAPASGPIGPRLTFARGEGVAVEFNLPPSNAHGLIEGELHLNWHGSGVGDPCGQLQAQIDALLASLKTVEGNIPGNHAIPGVLEHHEQQVDAWHQQHDEQMRRLQEQLAACRGQVFQPHTSVALAEVPSKLDRESQIESAVRNMSKQQQDTLVSSVGLNMRSAKRIALPGIGQPQNVPHLVSKSGVPLSPGPVGPVDNAKIQRDKRKVASICQLLGSNAFGDANVCASGSHLTVPANPSHPH